MAVGTNLISLRKQRGMTQEELADLTNVTVRTIQRIESGESTPRNFTLKALAVALEVPFTSLLEIEPETTVQTEPKIAAVQYDLASDKHFLQMFCLACFTFIIVPYVHFLIPNYLLKKRKVLYPQVLLFAQSLIRLQIIWVVVFHLLLLFALIYNMSIYRLNNEAYLINYIYVVFVMYIINIIIISVYLFKARRLKVPET